MLDSSPPRRLRHSWEARCRLVQLVNEGVAPARAAEPCGVSRATAYRLLADHSRVVVCELYPREDAASCVRFLDLVVARFAERGITIERVMTDNGSGYRSRDFKAALAHHQIRHLRTKPYTPRTNGKAE